MLGHRLLVCIKLAPVLGRSFQLHLFERLWFDFLAIFRNNLRNTLRLLHVETIIQSSDRWHMPHLGLIWFSLYHQSLIALVGPNTLCPTV